MKLNESERWLLKNDPEYNLYESTWRFNNFTYKKDLLTDDNTHKFTMLAFC